MPLQKVPTLLKKMCIKSQPSRERGKTLVSCYALVGEVPLKLSDARFDLTLPLC